MTVQVLADPLDCLLWTAGAGQDGKVKRAQCVVGQDEVDAETPDASTSVVTTRSN